ncbi:MAG: ATP-binding cassette domain-containing protein [Rhodobacteraceae bacterium]|nr:ATP-binding cassette domain-containing protein [Paracoccaceae bacterium]
MIATKFSFENLSGGYGDTRILSDISGSVSGGEVLGIFGRNGVGKTTLSRMLVGQIMTQSGIIKLNESDVTKTKNSLRRQLGVGYMPQTAMVFDGLTVKENLSLAKGASGPDEFFELFPRLEERLNQQAGSMSGGERKILAFVRTMMEDTDVIVLDEPTEGVQQENITNMETCISRRKQAGSAVILAEQNLTMLLNMSDRFLGLDSGSLVYSGTRKSTKRHNLVEVLSV